SDIADLRTPDSRSKQSKCRDDDHYALRQHRWSSGDRGATVDFLAAQSADSPDRMVTEAPPVRPPTPEAVPAPTPGPFVVTEAPPVGPARPGRVPPDCPGPGNAPALPGGAFWAIAADAPAALSSATSRVEVIR